MILIVISKLCLYIGVGPVGTVLADQGITFSFLKDNCYKKCMDIIIENKFYNGFTNLCRY